MTAFPNLWSLKTSQMSECQILLNVVGSFKKADLIFILFLELLQGAEEQFMTQKMVQTNLHFADGNEICVSINAEVL